MKKIFVYTEQLGLENYVGAVTSTGAQAIVSQNLDDALECDALLLTGGGDVNPKVYGEDNNGSEDIKDERDEAELKLLDMFVGAKKPIFGICRGFQIISIYFGGNMIQNLPDPLKEKHCRCGLPYDKVHMVTAKEGSFLHKHYGDHFSVNSSHHQVLDRVPDVLEVVCRNDDGHVEGYEHKTLNIKAVQFHPERMCYKNLREDTVDGKYIFESFLESI